MNNQSQENNQRYADSWLTKLRADQDWLYQRLSHPHEGWSVNSQDHNFDVPLNLLDATLYKILLKTILSKQKIAITLPRVKAGVSLSVVAYLVVNRLIKSSNRNPVGFTPAELNTQQRILILTKNRKLRDFFLTSSLNFSNNRTLFSDLAVERLTRVGKLEQIGRKISALNRFAPVSFYHFDSIENIPHEFKHSFVISEFTENDSSEVVRRFVSFIQQLECTSALVVLNSFDKNKISILESNQFSILNLSDEILYQTNDRTNSQNMPSLASSLSSYPEKISFEVKLIKDDFINEKLTNIVQVLLGVSKAINTDRPLILNTTWNLFYSLRNLAVPLATLEERRKKSPWLKSLKFNIDKTFSFPLSTLKQEQREPLQHIWGTLKVEFLNLYAHLEEKNEKYNKLKDIIKNNDNDTYILLPTQLESEALTEELFITEEWMEDEGTAQIRDIMQAILQEELTKHIILTGAWRPSEIPKILSLLPKKVTVLCYPCEIPSLMKSLKYINDDLPLQMALKTKDTLKLMNLLSDDLSTTVSNKAWIYPTEETQEILEQNKFLKLEEQVKEDEIDYANYDFDLVYDDVNEIDTEIDTTDSDEVVEAYKIRLENGTSIYVATNQQILSYVDEEDNIQTIFPESLREDDAILLYSYEQNREMFQEMVRRTKELTGVNQKYLAIWKNTIDLVRKAIAERYNGSFVMTIKMLKSYGCNKTDPTIRNWFKGLTMAPQDREDIEFILEYCVTKNARELSYKIHDEIERLREFNRRLGHRLKKKMGDKLRDSDTASNSGSRDRIDQELDEILESAEVIKVQEVSAEPVMVAKKDISKYIF